MFVKFNLRLFYTFLIPDQMKLNRPKYESMMEDQQGRCGVELFIIL